MQVKDPVLSYVEAFNQGDLDALCALFTPAALVWGVLGWGARDSASQYRQLGFAK